MAFGQGLSVHVDSQQFYAALHLAEAHLALTAHIRYCWLLNAGNANAGTGEPGMDACRQTIGSLAALTGTSSDTVWPFSTGVIGEPLPVQAICDAIPKAYDTCDSSVAAWERASRAIMTTDTHQNYDLSVQIGGQTVTLTGMAKGSGMIHPNMATMFGLIASDVAMTAEVLTNTAWTYGEPQF